MESGRADEMASRVNDSLIPIYKDQDGFQSLAVVDAGDSVVSISRWDSREQAESGAEAALGWAKEQSDLVKGNTGSFFGEEIAST